MLLSYSWLQSYLPKLPSPERLGEVLLLHGLDVEGVEYQADRYRQVVVGEIIAVRPHPNADKLRLADVVVTSGGQPQEIVCGAPNIEVGQKVPVALLGAQLPNGMTIESRAIRGVVSQGMLCAADELGLGDDHSGILVLDHHAKIGTPMADVLGLNDVIFDVTTPTNRADLMSMRGLAWEIGAMLKQVPKFPRVATRAFSAASSTPWTVQVEQKELCSLFSVRVIHGVRQQSLPQHILQRLTAAGMRSISPVVDITNYVMLEFGQPLHAYDARKIAGSSLIARPARIGERIVTLDNHARSLTPDMLVIADTEGPVGLAGVMGGQKSEVSRETTDILLEAAIFNAVSVRQTSRRLGLVSEASKRFERGLWPEVTIAALDAAADMIAEYCGGVVERERAVVGETKSPKTSLKIHPASIADRLGMKITAAAAKKVIEHLGFHVQGTVKEWAVIVPAWRPDVTIPENIIDEVGRIVGYEHLPKHTEKRQTTAPDLPHSVRFQEEVRNFLVDQGYTEVISHAFYGDESAQRVAGRHFEVANPLDGTQRKLRKSLLPQMLDVLTQQANAGRDAKIFEIGLVFDPEQTGTVDKQQSWKLAIGQTHKGQSMVSDAITALQDALVTACKPSGVLPEQDLIRGRMVESVEFDLRSLMADAKVNFGPWDPTRHIAKHVQVKELSKFPAVHRDISFWWPNDAAAITAIIESLSLPLLQDVTMKDSFTKDGKTSYAYHFVYQSPERTLQKSEVDAEEKKIKDALLHAGATIR